jgi:hypothetical protein
MTWMTEERCVACGRLDYGGNSQHHVLARASHTEYTDAPFNLMPLCAHHHRHTHRVGTWQFAEDFPSVKEWMIRNGFELCVTGRKKWLKPKAD